MLISCLLPHLVTGSLSSCCLDSPEGSSSSTASRLDAPIPLPRVCSLPAGHHGHVMGQYSTWSMKQSPRVAGRQAGPTRHSYAPRLVLLQAL